MTTATKERPIIFSGDMVRAILAGRKTQTRRVVKPQPDRMYVSPVVENGSATWHHDCDFDRFVCRDCPYGQPGDRLWVRETWKYVDWTHEGVPFVRYAADGSDALCEAVPDEWCDRLVDIWEVLSDEGNYDIDGKAADRSWRPSIHMPRWASRITLEVTDVRVERLQEISDADASAEGVDESIVLPGDRGSFIPEFRQLWDSINESRGYGWDANPWVWVVEFQKQETTNEWTRNVDV